MMRLLCSILGTSLMLIQINAYAHGGVSIEDDVCIMMIGRYKAHFTGYLPQERATQEFCEDIPTATGSVFVIDYISDELRKMDVDFRIVRDVKSIGLTATYADLGSEQDIEQATVFYATPERYTRGVITARHTFTNNGGYIGVVKATHPESGLVNHSVFPFRVGRPDYGRYLTYYILLFGFSGVFIYAAGRNRFFSSS